MSTRESQACLRKADLESASFGKNSVERTRIEAATARCSFGFWNTSPPARPRQNVASSKSGSSTTSVRRRIELSRSIASRRGKLIFEQATCSRCHAIGGQSSRNTVLDLAEDYQAISRLRNLLQQIVKPSAEIHKEFQTQMIVTDDGRLRTGPTYLSLALAITV